MVAFNRQRQFMAYTRARSICLQSRVVSRAEIPTHVPQFVYKISHTHKVLHQHRLLLKDCLSALEALEFVGKCRRRYHGLLNSLHGRGRLLWRC